MAQRKNIDVEYEAEQAAAPEQERSASEIPALTVRIYPARNKNPRANSGATPA